MFDFIFEIVCGKEYYVMVLTVKDEVLYGVPCEDEMSGYYANYHKEVRLSSMKVTEFMNCNTRENKAILIKKRKNELEIIPCFDSWDGFQPMYE